VLVEDALRSALSRQNLTACAEAVERQRRGEKLTAADLQMKEGIVLLEELPFVSSEDTKPLTAEEKRARDALDERLFQRGNQLSEDSRGDLRRRDNQRRFEALQLRWPQRVHLAAFALVVALAWGRGTEELIIQQQETTGLISVPLWVEVCRIGSVALLLSSLAGSVLGGATGMQKGRPGVKWAIKGLMGGIPALIEARGLSEDRDDDTLRLTDL